MSLKTFFETIFVKQTTIKNILELYPNVSEKGFKFERCADLLIKLGFLPIFSNDKFKHIISNINKGDIKYLTDFNKYLDKNTVNSGNKTNARHLIFYKNNIKY